MVLMLCHSSMFVSHHRSRRLADLCTICSYWKEQSRDLRKLSPFAICYGRIIGCTIACIHICSLSTRAYFFRILTPIQRVAPFATIQSGTITTIVFKRTAVCKQSVCRGGLRHTAGHLLNNIEKHNGSGNPNVRLHSTFYSDHAELIRAASRHKPREEILQLGGEIQS